MNSMLHDSRDSQTSFTPGRKQTPGEPATKVIHVGELRAKSTLCAVQGRYIENMFLGVPKDTYTAYLGDRCLVII
jgi:hypothetical protein